MRIAIEGCAHGELEIIYAALKELEKSDEKKVDLLICCGDFQSTRNLADLSCMAVPDKYREMCSFYKYYSGEKVAPVLTIFVGGNHEASNYLQELPYGGWVAPNIYYLGYAGVVNVAGVRIAGISGIYKSQDWMQGHHEKVPYSPSSAHSVYHVRNLEVFRLKQVSGKIDIFLSHDWPRGITRYGDERALIRNKPFFKKEVEADALGSPPCMELLSHHRPSYWFAAHLHCKFAALVPADDGTSRMTKFLALDKCLPKRKFLQILEIQHDEKLPIKISYDAEWLTILYLTNHLLSVKRGVRYMPGQGGSGRWMYTPTEAEKEAIAKKFDDNFEVPENFEQTCKPYEPGASPDAAETTPRLCINPQTTALCDRLGIDDPSVLLRIMTDAKDNSLHRDSSVEGSSDSRESSFILGDGASVPLDNDGDSSPDSSDRASPSPDNSPEEDFPLKNSNPPSTGNEDSNVVEDDKLLEKNSVEPNCKKFKRRNHSLYADTA